MTAAAAQQGTIMYKVGAIVLVGVALYFLFTAANTFGLAEQTVTASVVSKAFREAGKTYVTQVIGGKTYTRPQTTPEAYLVTVKLDGKDATGAVDASLFEQLQQGDPVHVVYQKRRLTGATQIVRVSR
jgi:hypothetical protein